MDTRNYLFICLLGGASDLQKELALTLGLEKYASIDTSFGKALVSNFYEFLNSAWETPT